MHDDEEAFIITTELATHKNCSSAMPLLHKPKYPVVDPDPTLERAVMNFSVFDVATIAGFTLAGYVTGHIGCE
jgi:hypothetical protein